MANQFIVAGGGIAGLTAAVALAEKGKHVTLFEQSKQLGGRAVTQHQDGFSLNLGPHALYRNGPLHQALQRWQISFSGRAPELRSGAYLVAGARKHLFPMDASRLFLTRALRSGEKLAAAKALRLVMTQDPEKAAGLTMQRWTEQSIGARGARQLVGALARLSSYCADLSRLSARAALRQVQFASKSGVLYLDHGWETLITGLAGKAGSLGVKLCPGVPVEHVESGAVRLADGRRVECDGAVLAVPPDSVERLTGLRLPRLEPVRIGCLDLGLRDAPSNYARFALGLERPFYLSMHSAVAALAPAGGALVHVGKYLLPGEEARREELEEFAEIALPGWRQRAQIARFLPNMTASYALPVVEGRPECDALGLPGVALAGDWIGNDAMLADAAAASALRAAELIGAPNALRRAPLSAAR